MVAPLLLYLGSALGAGLLGRSQAKAKDRKERQLLNQRVGSYEDILSPVGNIKDDSVPAESWKIDPLDSSDDVINLPEPMRRRRLLTSDNYPIDADYEQSKMLLGMTPRERREELFPQTTKLMDAARLGDTEALETIQGMAKARGLEEQNRFRKLSLDTAQKSLTPNFQTYTNPTSETLFIGGIEFGPGQSRPLNLNDLSVQKGLSGSALIPYEKRTEFEGQQVQIEDLDTKIKDFEFENQGVSRYDRTPAGRKLNEIYENRERLLSETYKDYKSSETLQREIGENFLDSIEKRIEGNESQYQKLEQMEAALDRLYKISPDLTGPLEATMLPFKSLLVDLGLPEEGFLEGVTAQEAVSAIHNAIVPFMRAEDSGPQSDFESRRLIDATMGLAKTPGANRFILKAYMAVQEFNKDVARETYEWNRINRNQYEKNKKGQTYEEYIEEKVPSIFTRLKMPQYNNKNQLLDAANNGSIKFGDYYFREDSQSVEIFGGG